jgi:hypothetical protein
VKPEGHSVGLPEIHHPIRGTSVTKDDELLCEALLLRASFVKNESETGLGRDLRDAAERIRTLASSSMSESAVRTLESLGYTYHGGELWKPPLGNCPTFLEGSASLPKVGYESYESLGMATRTGVTRDAKEIKPEQAISYTKSADMDQDIDPAVEALVKRKIAERDWRILKYGRDIEYL